MKQIIKIIRTNEGAIIKGLTDCLTNKSYSKSYVFNRENGNLDGLKELLYDIANNIEPSNKFDKITLNISIKHGYKYRCNEIKCKLCKEELDYAQTVIKSNKEKKNDQKYYSRRRYL